MSVVGARPQFIKAAIVSKEIRKHYSEILIHTGQHYDYAMSEKFFEELNIPRPDYNLGISGGTHAKMTGNMMISLEEVMVNEKPDLLIVYGDTNSTLAAALSAAKLHIPICHVEAGVRTHCHENPEEINRVCTDHVSSLLLAPTQGAMKELKIEGLLEKSSLVGDVMYDAFLEYSKYKRIEDVKIHCVLDDRNCKVPSEYYYFTCHREENSNFLMLKKILKNMNELDAYTVYPVHPRNMVNAKRIVAEEGLEKIILTDPVGYLDSLCLLNSCLSVVTDSGGLQREAFFAGKQCITLLDFVSWSETMVDNRNQLAKAEEIKIKLLNQMIIRNDYKPFGNGEACKRIVNEIEKKFL